MKNKWISALLLLLALLTGLFLYNRYRVAPGMDFTKLNLSDLDGRPVDFGSFKGRKMIVSFGASWCGNCWQELEAISKIRQTELADVEIIVISDEEPARIRTFSERKGYPYTFLKLNGKFADVGVHALPTNYILNRNLEVKKESVGYVDWHDPSTLEHLKKLMEQ